MSLRPRVAAAIVAVLVAGLAAGGGLLLANRDGGGSSGGGSNGGDLLSETEIRYRLLDRFGPVFFCDRDAHPVARDEGRAAAEWWAAANKSGEEVFAIRARLGIAGVTVPDPDVIRVYREHKKLAAIELQTGTDPHRFQLSTGSEPRGTRVSGTITRRGAIAGVTQSEVSLTCPVCLSAGTLIATPSGPVRIESLREGRAVWTVDDAGRRVIGTVLRTIRRAVALPRTTIRIALADGRTLAASPGHPTADGRLFASLAAGDVVDGSAVVTVAVERPNDPYTYDLLPSGPTGAYWADGVLLGSTLHAPPGT